MELVLILGPMKSGKSFDLISYFSPLKYATIPFALFQSARNVRDEHIWSRNGITLEAQKVSTLSEALGKHLAVIGIDEVHMFDESEAAVIGQLLREGTKVVASGLDTDYRGKLFGIVARLLELAPREVRYKRAVCEKCKVPEAVYTQVLQGTEPLITGMPAVIPDNGTFMYTPVCRHCFVTAG